MALALDLLGVKYQAVPAYRGLKEVETAILQNIGQMANSSLSGWSGSVEPTMGHVVLPLWQLSPRAKNGSYPRSQGAAQSADVRGVLRLGACPASRSPADRLRGAARGRRSAARDVPRRADAAEGVRTRRSPRCARRSPRCGRTRSSSRTIPRSSRPSRSWSPAPQGQAVLADLGTVPNEIKDYLINATNQMTSR